MDIDGRRVPNYCIHTHIRYESLTLHSLMALGPLKLMNRRSANFARYLARPRLPYIGHRRSAHEVFCITTWAHDSAQATALL